MTRPARPQSWILFLCIAVLVIVLDQGTKLLARRALPLHQFVPLLDSWFGFRRIYAHAPTFAGSELLATGIGTIASVGIFLIVWRGAWGQRDAVVALAIFLGGGLSTIIDHYYFRAGTEFLFLKVGAAVRLETDLSLVAIIAGTIALAISALMGRLPTDRIGPTHPRPSRLGS
jgi:lipoprotein signal peptidase